MKNDAISDLIFNAARPSIPAEQWDDHARGVFPVLFGAAVALLFCRELIERETDSLEAVKMWKPEDVWRDFEKQFKDNAPMDWRNGPHFSVWSIGFFLNRAQQNIAAALDRLVNGTLSRKLSIPLAQEGRTENLQLWCLWVGTRCRILTVLGLEPCIHARFVALGSALDCLVDTEKAKNALALLVEKCSTKRIEDTLESTRTVELSALDEPNKLRTITDADCVAIACGLNNAFKHQVLGAGTRKGPGHLVSWCVLARAVVCLGELWHDFTRSTKTLQESS